MLQLIAFDQNNNETKIVSQEQLEQLTNDDILVFFEDDDTVLDFENHLDLISRNTTLVPQQVAEKLLKIVQKYENLYDFYAAHQHLLKFGPVYINRTDKDKLPYFLEKYDIDPIDLISEHSDDDDTDINLNRKYIVWEKGEIYSTSEASESAPPVSHYGWW